MSLETNKVHLMDAITGMDQMDPESVDLVVTSPPYDQLRTYNDSSGWNFETFTKIADGLIKVLKPGGVICWNVADSIVELHKKSGTSKTGTSFRQCLYFMDNGLNFHDNLLYEKPAARFSSGSRSLRYSDVYEYVFVLSKGRPKTINLIQDKKNKGYGTSFTRDGGRNKDGTRNRDAEKKKIPVKEFGVRHNIWKIVNSYGVGQKNKKAYEHPALMPMQLANDLIKSYTNPGDVVLDPFMGSGTTARESYSLDRDWIGFEIDETYHTLCEEINTAEMNSIFDKV